MLTMKRVGTKALAVGLVCSVLAILNGCSDSEATAEKSQPQNAEQALKEGGKTSPEGPGKITIVAGKTQTNIDHNLSLQSFQRA